MGGEDYAETRTIRVAEYDFVASALAMLIDEATAKKAMPAVAEALASAQKASKLDKASKPQSVSRRVAVSVDGGDGQRPESVSAVFNKRTPIDAGPKKRVPIRVGGGSCFSVKISSRTYTVCVDWEQKL